MRPVFKTERIISWNIQLIFPAEQPIYGNVQDIRKSGQFVVRNVSNLTFQLGKTGGIHVYTVYLKLGKKLLLLHTKIFPCHFNAGSN